MATPRPRPQVMSITDAAAARIAEIMSKAGSDAAGIRVGVEKGGCAGMSYKVELAKDTKPGDEVIDSNGHRVLIDPTAVLFLLGTQMDYKIDKMSATFVFNNPNQTSACGCGESVAITPAQVLS
ncbi:iron-binding protein IscA [Variibacter gotjawalensis]|uniref:Iron-binding protein IscA n=1 Tax=Variibacter gotjawalensis TaxID=1333996 RepID=A0A0S3PY29_9BRAD|nr:iron-sulfur cluster assembly accessory protein [Variibacter gotjawalensis]NIK46676.1 iron-sulfur cluster assembly protein [Variibacter gotjawalensis]RZS48579.1 iron-sulfur cluster assembly protein [Variibacter gotjawalensis]BAT60841.1 iron-binding protein IscA [Variibacter gotjawalensis]